MKAEPGLPEYGEGWTSARLIRSVLGMDRLRLSAATALAAGHQIGETLVPVTVGVVIDEAIDGGPPSALLTGIALLALVFAGLSYSYRFFARLDVRLEESAAHQVRLRLTRHVLDARGAVHQQSTGALQRLANTDTAALAGVVRVIPSAVAAVAALVVAMIALFSVSTQLGLAVAAATVVTLAIMHLLGRPFEARIHADQERSAEVSGVAADLIGGIRVVKGLGADQAAASRYRRVSQASLEAALRSARFEATYVGMASFVTGSFLAFVAFVAGREAIVGDISVGALISVVGLAQFLIGPLDRLISSSAQLALSRASARRIASVLASPMRHPDSGEEATASAGPVGFDAVRMGGLRNLTLDVGAGSMTGLAAADPVTSTALLDLLAAEVQPDQGDARLDGVPLRLLDPDSVRSVMLAPPHDVDLFDSSLRDNLRLGSLDEGAVEDATAAAAVHDVIESLPDGINSRVGERGLSLSGGQKQRVALARAIAAQPPVLVLHEPTTAVDTATEAAIASGLRSRRCANGLTTILVTTSPTLLAVCDEVVLFVDRDIAGRGTHDELMASERYREVVLG